MTTEIKVSVAAYNEIANALEASGKKIERGSVISIEKDDKIINPIDWRLVQVRRDSCEIAKTIYNGEKDDFVFLANEIFEYILKAELPKDEVKPSKSTQWK